MADLIKMIPYPAGETRPSTGRNTFNADALRIEQDIGHGVTLRTRVASNGAWHQGFLVIPDDVDTLTALREAIEDAIVARIEKDGPDTGTPSP